MTIDCWIVLYCDHEGCLRESGGEVAESVTMAVDEWVRLTREANASGDRAWAFIDGKDYCENHKDLHG